MKLSTRPALRWAILNTGQPGEQMRARLFDDGRHARPRWLVALAFLGLVGLMLSAAGCASWQGARLYQSGTAALEAGDVDRALADLSEAARLVPDGSEIHNHLGIARLESGDEQRALLSFERAVELDCDNQAASDNLARLERRMSREAAVDRVASPAARPPAQAPGLAHE
jgi:tetratricopeptide (TPR) repeat protein